MSNTKIDFSSVNKASLSDVQMSVLNKLQKLECETTEDVFNKYEQCEHEFFKELGSYECNDSGNAKRFIAIYKGKVKFNATMKMWLVWNGKYWELDEKKKVFEFAQQVERYILRAASIERDFAKAKSLAKWAIQSNNRRRIDDMLALAESGLAVSEDELDQNHYFFNLANGTYDLAKGIFAKHNPEDNLTKISSEVNHDPAAKCPEWEKFLDYIFEGNKDIVGFVQRAIGYSLCGDTSGQCFFFAHGTGKNGKSAMFNVLKMLFGDYYQKTNTEMLLARKMDRGIPNDLARLKGARFVVASELPEGRYMNEEVIKDLTGSDTIPARFLYKEWFDFVPTHTLWIYGNHKPIIRGQDPAIWRRPKLIPFNVKIPVEKELPMETLMKTMKQELSGIFNWALQGFKDYRITGLQTPKVIEDAVEMYKEEMDVMDGFISELLIEKVGDKVKCTDVITAWEHFCKQNGEMPGTGRAFIARLKQRDRRDGTGKYQVVTGAHNIRYWKDLTLVEWWMDHEGLYKQKQELAALGAQLEAERELAKSKTKPTSPKKPKEPGEPEYKREN